MVLVSKWINRRTAGWSDVRAVIRTIAVQWSASPITGSTPHEKNMAKISGGDNPASQKMIASRMEAISPACFPSRRALVALDEHIDEEPHLGGEMAAMGVKKVDVVGFDLELLQ